VLQESDLATSQFSELNTNLSVVDLQDTNAHINIVLLTLFKIISASLCELNLVLVSANFDLNFVFLEVLNESFLNHIRVVRREELGIVIEYLFVLIKLFLGLIKLIINVELSSCSWPITYWAMLLFMKAVYLLFILYSFSAFFSMASASRASLTNFSL